MFNQFVQLLLPNAKYIKKIAFDRILRPFRDKQSATDLISESTETLELSTKQRDQIIEEIRILLKNEKTLQQTLKKEQDQRNTANEQLFLELLGIFDTLEFLVDYLSNSPEPSAKSIKRLSKQLEVLQRKLVGILEQRKVELIEDLNHTKPDFNLCVVVDREVRNDLEDQTITKVVKKGFRIENRVLRAIEVITSKQQ
ncbi:nucleotide exchange factor GrpE [Cylindrospermopsis raciborskii]|uniref:nucleotide exchange factor GrpE n=1 Tax=Cylindrospermopsis raciborskii TaxID=77022 RepID=UPI0022C087F9|nr:nucleotide exchange factor GrpE [Cylindrospermopsis raciborskii]MCZ2203034.1 nucleotide exchange factor GrpE [Cylindrospermopsis raciborskii PAMP2012]MCZ2205982.1 nucleotide exchange factor GrpE [Cylindrospermopsis raciborskii PAMP2011]